MMAEHFGRWTSHPVRRGAQLSSRGRWRVALRLGRHHSLAAQRQGRHMRQQCAHAAHGMLEGPVPTGKVKVVLQAQALAKAWASHRPATQAQSHSAGNVLVSVMEELPAGGLVTLPVFGRGSLWASQEQAYLMSWACCPARPAGGARLGRAPPAATDGRARRRPRFAGRARARGGGGGSPSNATRCVPAASRRAAAASRPSRRGASRSSVSWPGADLWLKDRWNQARGTW